MPASSKVFNSGRAALAGASLLVASCASISYIDDEGVTHVAGFVNMKIAPSGGAHGYQATGSSITLTGVGVSIIDAGETAGATLGYYAEHVTTLNENACYGEWPASAAGTEPTGTDDSGEKPTGEAR